MKTPDPTSGSSRTPQQGQTPSQGSLIIDVLRVATVAGIVFGFTINSRQTIIYSFVAGTLLLALSLTGRGKGVAGNSWYQRVIQMFKTRHTEEPPSKKT